MIAARAHRAYWPDSSMKRKTDSSLNTLQQYTYIRKIVFKKVLNHIYLSYNWPHMTANLLLYVFSDEWNPMKSRQLTEKQIIRISHEAEAGVSVADIFHKHKLLKSCYFIEGKRSSDAWMCLKPCTYASFSQRTQSRREWSPNRLSIFACWRMSLAVNDEPDRMSRCVTYFFECVR